jgi:hypothetical protein
MKKYIIAIVVVVIVLWLMMKHKEQTAAAPATKKAAPKADPITNLTNTSPVYLTPDATKVTLPVVVAVQAQSSSGNIVQTSNFLQKSPVLYN